MLLQGPALSKFAAAPVGSLCLVPLRFLLPVRYLLRRVCSYQLTSLTVAIRFAFEDPRRSSAFTSLLCLAENSSDAVQPPLLGAYVRQLCYLGCLEEERHHHLDQTLT